MLRMSKRSGRLARLALVPAAALLAPFVPQAGLAAQPSESMPPQNEAQRVLADTIRAIGENFDGDIGIAVEDVQTGWTTAYDGNTFFPQQSVSKFWVALTALDKVDKGELSLTAPFTLHKEDITLFHQPITAQIGANGYTTNVAELMTRALQQSDNTCNDAVLWRAGGPEAVRAFLRAKGIEGVRFGPGERKLQSAIAGIEWHQSYAYNGGFYKARDALPMAKRRAAFEHYIANPLDGATPLGVADALTRLKRGELLSPESTRRLLGIMSHTKTGPQRLKGGLQPGWSLSHKTGTGQVLGGVQAGYNDIGVITGPDGHAYAMAVMIRRSSSPLQQRMAAMQKTVRAVIAYHGRVESTDMAGYHGAGSYGGR